MTIDGKKQSKPRTTTPGTPRWRPWNGKEPLDAKHIAKAATRLFYKCGYDNFKFKKVYKTEKREINGFWRYRVKFTAKKCKKSKEVDTCKKGRKDKKGRKGKKGKKCEKEKKIILYDCYKNSKEFEAIFRDNVVHDSLRLNVTNIENGNSCTLVIKY
uniref:Lipocalin n=1 Tax=Strongyloides venezuelensis TaxID=75913 RepID=A0A0K0FZJ5_STRVS